MRRAFWMTLSSFVLASIGAACTSFGTVPAPDAGPGPESDASTPLLDGSEPSADASPAIDGPAPEQDAAACKPVSGPNVGCSACSVEPLYTVAADPSGDGPFVFGVGVDATTLYWIEQSGSGTGLSAYDGSGATSVVRSLPLGGGKPRTLATASASYTHLVVTPTSIWLASSSRATPVARIDKACSQNCTIEPKDSALIVKSVVPFQGGIAVGADDGIRQLSDGAATRFVGVSSGVSSLTRLGAGLAYVSQGASAPSAVAFTSGGSYSLLAADPSGDAYAPRGASHVAASCGEPLWARQVFRKADGTDFRSALVEAKAAGGTTGFLINANVFAMVADTTHVYLGLPDSGGVRRVGKGESAMTTVIANVSAWSLAIDDTYVYFDDHGTDRTKSSLGIRRMKKSALP